MSRFRPWIFSLPVNMAHQGQVVWLTIPSHVSLSAAIVTFACGPVRCREKLGGLIKEYYREAANMDETRASEAACGTVDSRTKVHCAGMTDLS